MTSSPARTLLLLLAAAVLGACGGGLYTAAGLPAAPGGSGDVCGARQVSCAGVCTAESVAACGTACEACAGTPPAGAVLACVGVTDTTHGTCGYQCTDGTLACPGGCCGASALAAGPAHTCALLSDGSVRCWGDNAAGQLGTGDTRARLTPSAVPLPGAAVAVGSGVGHACAVLSGGAVRCWGANGAGQVTGSAGGTVLSPAATPVASGAVAVAAGAAHTCALLSSGAIRCWGASGRTGGGQPVASGATALAAGKDHTCAVVAGAVRCWGANALGQLGTATTSDTSATPIAAGIAVVAAFADQTCAATGASNGQAVDDAIQCWGDSLGAGYLLAAPQRTPAIPLRKVDRSTVQYPVTMAAAGAHFVCVRNKTEAVECFGANDQNQLGGALVEAGTTAQVPLPTAAVPVAIALAAGDAHACAVLTDGRIRCWGANGSGQLGDGTTVSPALGVLVAPSGE